MSCVQLDLDIKINYPPDIRINFFFFNQFMIFFMKQYTNLCIEVQYLSAEFRLKLIIFFFVRAYLFTSHTQKCYQNRLTHSQVFPLATLSAPR